MYKYGNITPIIVTGGLGTHLSTLVPDKTKVLAPVNGRPFICYLLDEAGRAGLRKVIPCRRNKAREVEETLGIQTVRAE